jgi:hypothetical protein
MGFATLAADAFPRAPESILARLWENGPSRARERPPVRSKRPGAFLFGAI